MAEQVKIYDRILQVAVTADESDDSLDATAVTFFRDRNKLDDSDGVSITHTADAASGTIEVQFGEGVPPFTHLRLVSTFQA